MQTILIKSPRGRDDPVGLCATITFLKTLPNEPRISQPPCVKVPTDQSGKFYRPS